MGEPSDLIKQPANKAQEVASSEEKFPTRAEASASDTEQAAASASASDAGATSDPGKTTDTDESSDADEPREADESSDALRPLGAQNWGGWKSLPRYRALLWLMAILVLYALYVNGLSKNPPGFYLDESLLSYNAYEIYRTGRGEFGHYLPLYFPVFRLPPPHYFLGYADPTYIYILAALYFVFPPSIMLSRLLSVTAGFVAALLLGKLAARISHRSSIGTIVALTALLTPWLFEIGRLVFGVALYPLVLVLFLSTLHHTHRKETWSLFASAVLAVTLALITYTYSIGRLLGPLLAFGLLFFATDVKRFRNVIKTWIVYGITLLPLLVFHLRHPEALTGRFNQLSYITPQKSLWEISTEFVNHYIRNISPRRLLFIGDENLRHHITDTGPILAATLILAVVGIFVVLARHRKDPWWRFILFGLVVSVVPGALTRDVFHFLRLIALPIFLLVLTVPTLMWLLDGARNKVVQGRPRRYAVRTSIFRLSFAIFIPAWLHKVATRSVLRGSLVVLLVLTLLQAVLFQVAFRRVGPKRGLWFDDAYPRVLAAALTKPTRPIYLVDGYWGQAYLHAYWYATVQGIDLSNFVHLSQGTRPPAGSLVLSSENKCSNCEMILKDDTYLLYWAR